MKKLFQYPRMALDFQLKQTEMVIDETLKLCGISGEDASMIAIEVMKKLGKSDETSVCCRSFAERREVYHESN